MFPALVGIASGALCGIIGIPFANAADVRGQLVLGSIQVSAAAGDKPPRAAFNWELDNGVKELVPTRVAPRELAVVLVGNGPPAPSAAGAALEVSISGGALLPATLVVRAGTTLRIRNDDEIGHELYAVGLDTMSAEATSPGAVRAAHLTKPGSWPVKDHLAPHARAHLHVLSNLVAVAKLEANGSFTFDDVPAGKYTLKVLRGGSELVSKDIDVGDKTLTIDPLTAGSSKTGS
jgi:plastocyanin